MQLFMILGVIVLVWRLVDLQVVNREFLQNKAEALHFRLEQVPAHRGMVTDRNGEPVAISTPIDAVWADPHELLSVEPALSQLARVLGLPKERVRRTVRSHSDREFVYIKRQVTPSVAKRVMEMGLAGVGLRREYRRYYPASEVFGHVIGFTDVDDRGQEGIELAFDDWLRGQVGRKQVVKDGRRRTVAEVASIRSPQPGKDLRLSLERRLQYVAYRGLAEAVQTHGARAGSAVLLNVVTGEVLAMVNQPTFNPNNRHRLRGEHYRNRAITDPFEPGSTIKPFTVAAALESGAFTPSTPVDTGKGYLRVGHKTIHDIGHYGLIDVATVLRKSSNVGATKIALALSPETLWQMFSAAGFGELTGSGFPGESAGYLPHFQDWAPIEHATLAYGYGLAVTPLQLARAYAAIAAEGILRPVSFLPVEHPPVGRRILSRQTAQQMRTMLEAVVSDEGTGKKAQIEGYRIAGKTGTVHKSIAGGYAEHRYLAVFAGMAPASNPRLVLVVMLDEPSGKKYYGGEIAAPVFARIMQAALRLLNVPPDDLPALRRDPLLPEVRV